ncbi:MAG: hypothetical protein ACRCZE_05095 [Candidatus Altimarinota bacterium]
MNEQQKIMQYRHGDENAGFHLVCMPHSNRLSVELWGMWRETDLTELFKRQVLDCMNELKAKGEWDVFGDLSKFSVQMEVVFDLILNLMREAKRRKVRRVAVVHDSAIIAMAIRRLAAMSGLSTRMEFFAPDKMKGESAEEAMRRTKVEAEKWLLKKL